MIFQFKNEPFYYEMLGEGTPILMLHGLGADMQLMKGCMEPVFKEKGGYKRIYIDLPGMGGSSAALDFATADGVLEVLTAFAEEVIKGDFLVAGQSYGGYLARGILSAFPERTAGLLLLCPVVIPTYEKRTLPENKKKKIDQSFFQTLSPEEQHDMMQGLVRINSENYEKMKAELLSGRERANTEFVGRLLKSYSFSFDLEKRIGVYNKPAAFIVGRQDHITGYQDVWALVESYPSATFAALDMAGHALQIDRPELFAALVREWLQRIEDEN